VNENVKNIENTKNIDNHQLDEIMNNVAANFVDIHKFLKT
jgi:hypothetical protein